MSADHYLYWHLEDGTYQPAVHIADYSDDLPAAEELSSDSGEAADLPALERELLERLAAGEADRGLELLLQAVLMRPDAAEALVSESATPDSVHWDEPRPWIFTVADRYAEPLEQPELGRTFMKVSLCALFDRSADDGEIDYGPAFKGVQWPAKSTPEGRRRAAIAAYCRFLLEAR